MDSGVRQRPDQKIRRLYVHTDTLPDPDLEPVRVERLRGGALLITGHTGAIAADVIPHIIARLDDDELRLWLDSYSVYDASTAYVRQDWMSALQSFLWIPTCRATLPEHLRWR